MRGRNLNFIGFALIRVREWLPRTTRLTQQSTGIQKTRLLGFLATPFADNGRASEMIRDRIPVWSALSEFFLDTELRDDDYRRIAEVLGRSPYSENALWEILRFEVYPPCHWNLLYVAGEWAMFGDDWLMERVAPRCGKRPRFTWPALHLWMFQDHWDKVRAFLRQYAMG